MAEIRNPMQERGRALSCTAQCAVHTAECEGHSAVLYIKLSALWLSSGGKWSLVARRDFVIQLKQSVSPAPRPLLL